MSRTFIIVVSAWLASLLIVLSLMGYSLARQGAPATPRETAVDARERASDRREAASALRESALTEREIITDHAILEELHTANLPEKVAASASTQALLIILVMSLIGLIGAGHGLSWWNQRKTQKTLEIATNRIKELIDSVPESCMGMCRLNPFLPFLPEDETTQQEIRDRIAKFIGEKRG